MAPGSMVEVPARTVTVSAVSKASVPAKRVKICPAAAEKALCPEVYSPNGGVTTVASWYGVQVEPSISTIPLPGPPHPRMVLPLYSQRM